MDKETPSLKLSTAARMWVVAGRLYPPFYNQMVLEGRGDIDRERLKGAICEASQANPGSRFVLKGLLGAGRWIDSGKSPGLREVDAGHWDGMNSKGAPFLTDCLSPFSGPSCEVLLMRGDPFRVAFRSHHGVMDGRGTMTWAEDVFRVLRGEGPLGSDPTVSEDDLLNVRSGKIEKAIPYDYISPVGPARGSAAGNIWRRVSMSGRFRTLLPNIMVFVAGEAWRHSGGKVRFGIPVDMRIRREGLRSTNNLTNAIYIEVTPQSTPDELARVISRRVEERDDGVYTLEDKIIRHLPLRLLEALLKKEVSRRNASGNYRYTGFISNLGRIPLEQFSGGGFAAEACFFIPPGLGLLPFFLGLSGSGERVELVLSMPEALAGDGRMEDLLGKITDHLEKIKT